MAEDKVFLKNAIEATIRIGLLLVLVSWCFEIVRPFMIPIAWGVIIAVAVFPYYRSLTGALGGRRVAAAALMALLGLVILITPAAMLSATLVEGARWMSKSLQSGSLQIPPPPDSVLGWPLVGEWVHQFWALASANLSGALATLSPQLKAAAGWLLPAAAGAGFGVLQFLIAIVIASFLLATSEDGGKAAQAIARRISGERGAEFAKLAEATVRSVTSGILGVALIQSLLAGIGFLAAGIPGAGLWALLCLILSTVQIGVVPIVLPAVIYVFSTAGTATAVIFLIWSIGVMVIDNILKPILLGRGVQVPTAVIFVGAIGGFISWGIIGLFVGSVVLVLSYRLILAWIEEAPEAAAPG
ncbi:MAG: AI-2E family transporter [Burkholderiales bacterium]|nr:AI-2E family transporter [Burkholderiales bacterium]